MNAISSSKGPPGARSGAGQGAGEALETLVAAAAGGGALIALVGADGSGKSTLAAMLAEVLGRHRRAQACYLGLGSADIRDRIAAFGGPGRWLAGRLVKRADQTRSKSQKIPGVATAAVMYGLSRKRLAGFRRAWRLCEDGAIVVTDRYPQTEVAGIYDGPLLSAARAEGPVVRWLAAIERRLYERMIATPPDLVIKLLIDVDTALARKPDHRRRDIEIKVAVTARLTFNGAPMIEIDAARPLAQVFADITDAVLPALGIADGANPR